MKSYRFPIGSMFLTLGGLLWFTLLKGWTSVEEAIWFWKHNNSSFLNGFSGLYVGILQSGAVWLLFGLCLILCYLFKSEKVLVFPTLINLALIVFLQMNRRLLEKMLRMYGYTHIYSILGGYLFPIGLTLLLVLCFLKNKPLVLCCLAIACIIAHRVYDAITYLFNGSFDIITILCTVLVIAGMVLMGIWIYSPYDDGTIKKNPLYTKDHELQELIKYKELLDCNAITQDEFDKKKKELLNH